LSTLRATRHEDLLDNSSISGRNITYCFKNIDRYILRENTESKKKLYTRLLSRQLGLELLFSIHSLTAHSHRSSHTSRPSTTVAPKSKPPPPESCLFLAVAVAVAGCKSDPPLVSSPLLAVSRPVPRPT
jgi:hypothetical protein